MNDRQIDLDNWVATKQRARYQGRQYPDYSKGFDLVVVGFVWGAAVLAVMSVLVNLFGDRL